MRYIQGLHLIASCTNNQYIIIDINNLVYDIFYILLSIQNGGVAISCAHTLLYRSLRKQKLCLPTVYFESWEIFFYSFLHYETSAIKLKVIYLLSHVTNVEIFHFPVTVENFLISD